MAHWFKARELFMQKGWRPERSAIPYAVAPTTWQGWTLTVLWIAASLATEAAAATQGPRLFFCATVSVVCGTTAALWMLRGRVRPARR